MHPLTLHFHLIGLTRAQAGALRAIPPRAKFAHDIAGTPPDAASPQTTRDRDIVLLGAGCAGLAGSMTRVRPILVYDGALPVPSADLPLFEELWPCPDTEAFVHHVGRLLDRMERLRALTLRDLCLDALLETTPSLVWFKNLEGEHFSASRQFRETAGLSAREIEGSTHARIWGMSEDEYLRSDAACRQSDEETLRRGGRCICEEMVLINGELRPFSTVKNVLRDSDGAVIGTVGVATDATNLRMLGAEVDVLIENLPFAVLIADNTHSVLRWNTRFDGLFGDAGTIIRGRSLYHPGADRRCTRGDVLRNELSDLDPDADALAPRWRWDDDSVWIEVQNVDIVSPAGTVIGTIALFSDVTEDERLHDGLVRDAAEDPLTGMYNRRHFYEHTEMSASMGLLFLDLDHFKRLNDSLGHSSGDECLRLTAGVLMDIDPQFARLGGDEFVLSRSRTTQEEMEALALETSRRVNDVLKGRFPMVTPSIGVLYSRERPDSIDEAMGRVDAAMYVNKNERSKLRKLERMLAQRREKGITAGMAGLEKGIMLQRRRSGPYTVYVEGLEHVSSRSRRVRHVRRAGGRKDGRA